MGKGEYDGKKHVLLFPQFFLPFERQNILVTFILLSANTFSLVECKILLFGKELTTFNPLPDDKF